MELHFGGPGGHFEDLEATFGFLGVHLGCNFENFPSRVPFFLKWKGWEKPGFITFDSSAIFHLFLAPFAHYLDQCPVALQSMKRALPSESTEYKRSTAQ